MAVVSGKKQRIYLGIDVGGTKIQVSAITEAGVILASRRAETPRDVAPSQVMDAIADTILKTLEKIVTKASTLSGIGIAIPGVVDPRTGLVVKTPNMNLSGLPVGRDLKKRFGVPVFLGNDCNLGALGEAWLGSARGARSAVVMLVGTGIGGGIVRKGRILRGEREVAGEVGHMILDTNAILTQSGPICGCGSRGCFETLASRTAIERQIRDAVAAGESTILSEMLGNDLSVIRSGALREALQAGDLLVTKVVRQAATVLGYGCLTIRHLLDPEVIVLGGGVIEACADWMMPVVEDIVSKDPMPGARPDRGVLISALGDDAVVYGAAALAMTRTNRSRSLFGKRVTQPLPLVPTLFWGGVSSIIRPKKIADTTKSSEVSSTARLSVDGEPINVGVIIAADGSVKKLKPKKDKKKEKVEKGSEKSGKTEKAGRADKLEKVSAEQKNREKAAEKALENAASMAEIDPFGEKQLRRAASGGPDVVFIGTGVTGELPIPERVTRYFAQRAIRVEPLPIPALVTEYNRSVVRRAAIIPVEN